MRRAALLKAGTLLTGGKDIYLEKQKFQQSTNQSLVDVRLLVVYTAEVGGSSPSMGHMALVAQLGERYVYTPF